MEIQEVDIGGKIIMDKMDEFKRIHRHASIMKEATLEKAIIRHLLLKRRRETGLAQSRMWWNKQRMEGNV